ncbi:MAG: dicarboxylate/amino acid:cation symporter [Nitrosomonas sp.]|nr:MAG: dicarboxylate/amino acid:cation symporter [Nitrosomonas sp.]
MLSRASLNSQIVVGVLLGVLIGAWLTTLDQTTQLAQQSLYFASLASTLFIDLLKMVLVPLVFSSIVVGVANLQTHHQINRVWVITLAYFLLTMMLAVLLGLFVTNSLRPGEELQIAMFQDMMQASEVKQMSWQAFFAHFLHSLFLNPLAAMAQGQILAVVVFALLFGVALVVGGDRYTNILNLMKELLELILMLVNWIMRLAPFGIMALLIQLIVSQDIELLMTLIQFVAVVIGTTLFHGLIILPLILYLTTGTTPLKLWKGSREALITALATSSSAATLPITLRCVEQYLHVKPDVARFVLPVGATMNMDGTALYEAIAALFIANLAGIDLNLTQQLIIFFTAMFAAIGAPGIPSAGMITMVMVLQAVGLPVEAIAILLPIDRLLDTFRTMVNVEGDIVGSMVVQYWVDKP